MATTCGPRWRRFHRRTGPDDSVRRAATNTFVPKNAVKRNGSPTRYRSMIDRCCRNATHGQVQAGITRFPPTIRDKTRVKALPKNCAIVPLLFLVSVHVTFTIRPGQGKSGRSHETRCVSIIQPPTIRALCCSSPTILFSSWEKSLCGPCLTQLFILL